MARTTDEIKETLQTLFMNNATLAAKYGFTLGADYWSVFSKVSIENIFLYIVAYCAHVVEVLFDDVKSEIADMIEAQVPGRIDWYAKKLKEFLYNIPLNEIGEYETNLLTEEEINSASVVKHAVAIEDTAINRLVLKVAGEDGNGNKVPLSSSIQTALEAYIMRVKYAGVNTILINETGDTFDCNIDIWYDPLLLSSDVQTNCRNTIKTYIQNLPFNGEYSNMALIDNLQAVKGVKVAELTMSQYKPANNTNIYPISAKVTPYAGYFNIGNITLTMHEYE